ncbi:hypothetical protein AOLI_G00145730 [Acnodon oligacanthus]
MVVHFNIKHPKWTSGKERLSRTEIIKFVFDLETSPGKCCELPADIPNGRYVIVSGTDFVYGATIKYICKEGYQMVSRRDNKTCLAGGWDNHLPVCAELSCTPT